MPDWKLIPEGTADTTILPFNGDDILLAAPWKDWDLEKEEEIKGYSIFTGHYGAHTIFGITGDYWCDNGATQCQLPEKPKYWDHLPTPPSE